MAVGTSGTINDLAAPGRRRPTATSRAARTASPSTCDQLRPLQRRIVRMSTAERRRLPGIEDKRAELLPAGVDAARGRARRVRRRGDDHQRLGAARRHRARRGAARTTPTTGPTTRARCAAAAVAGLARRCGSDIDALAARRAPRARASSTRRSRCTSSATTTARCSSTRRCSTTSASTCRARVTTGTPRTSSSTRSYAASRPTRSSSSPRSCAIIGGATRRHRSPRVRRARQERPRPACASSRRCCASPTASTAAAGAVSTRVDVEVGTDLVVLRLHASDDAELELWGVRRRRDLFEKVFERELEATVAPRVNSVVDARRLTR